MKKLTTRRILSVLIVAIMIVAAFPGTAAAASSTKPIAVTLKVDGATVSGAYKVGSEVLVPAQVLKDNFGASTSYSSSSKKMTVKLTAHNFSFKMGSKSFKHNGSSKTAGIKANVVTKKPMIPIKAFMKTIGGSYKLSGKTCTIKYFNALKGSIKITGSTTVFPIASSAASLLRYNNKNLSVAVSGGGSGAGINDTIAGTNNLGMSSRELTAKEKNSIKSFPIARDAICLIVHPSNKVKNLTKAQAEKIFLGQITNWKDVGGANAPIVVMSREVGSGTRATLEELLLDKKSIKKGATNYSSSTTILNAVAKNKNAIGYDSIGFIKSKVKVVTLGQVKPSAATVKNGSYLLGRNLYLLSKGTPKGVSAMFIDYLKTPAAQQKIVATEGYIKIK